MSVKKMENPETLRNPVMTIRSVKILLVCKNDFFGKLAKIGQYFGQKSVYLKKSQLILKFA